MTCVLAIDPGLTGALAFYYPETADRVSVIDMPVVDGRVDPHQLRKIIEDHKPAFAVIELVNPMPRDGVKQAWRFASAFTTAHVVVAMLQIPISFVTPAQWKRVMKVAGGDEGKEECRALAIRLFPACAASFARKKDDGRAEAALLALYHIQTYGRQAAE
jgi:hypothetical protein